jgi:tetratricopeptide (TPR) repeat protein
LVAELGRGAAGRVYLACQPHLADRPVILKVTRGGGTEHLSLARLQHSYIVPLYSAQTFPGTDLRGLCMPYLGGMSLAVLLSALANTLPEQRTSQQLLDELDRATPHGFEPPGVRLERLRQALVRSSYTRVMVSFAARLAEALAYAHERGLVHLDLKPGNVLVTADGQPMLLDFHLARAPIRAGSPAPDWLGGTRGYMAPEQEAAREAVRNDTPVPRDVDGRADLHALGALLYEALAGELPAQPIRGPLRGLNPQVSPGLEDIIVRCLHPDPNQRYPDAAALASDLRRHLADQPLQGVPNRSLAERWRKWRRRSPGALVRAVLLAGLVGVVLTFLALVVFQGQGDFRAAEQALYHGRQLLVEGRPADAERVLREAVQASAWLPGGGRLNEELEQERQRAVQQREEQERRIQQGGLVQNLARLADDLRFFWEVEALPEAPARALEARCARLWSRKEVLWQPAGPRSALSSKVQEDLLDLVVLWSRLRDRLAAEAEKRPADRAILRTLDEAETVLGPSLALEQERQRLRGRLGLSATPGTPPRTPWDHFLLGRSLLLAGQVEEAAAQFRIAVEGQPNGFWPHFYQGVCAYRLKHYSQADAAFRVCLALKPEAAPLYHNRSLALAGQPGGEAAALQAADRAVALDPRLAPAWSHRGWLHYQLGRLDEALADFTAALACGADPAATHYSLARIHADRADRNAARKHLELALKHRPDHPEAQALLRQLP